MCLVDYVKTFCNLEFDLLALRIGRGEGVLEKGVMVWLLAL